MRDPGWWKRYCELYGISAIALGGVSPALESLCETLDSDPPEEEVAVPRHTETGQRFLRRRKARDAARKARRQQRRK